MKLAERSGLRRESPAEKGPQRYQGGKEGVGTTGGRAGGATSRTHTDLQKTPKQLGPGGGHVARPRFSYILSLSTGYLLSHADLHRQVG